MSFTFFQGICDYWTGLQDVAPNSHLLGDPALDGNYWDHNQVKKSRNKLDLTVPNSFFPNFGKSLKYHMEASVKKYLDWTRVRYPPGISIVLIKGKECLIL
jgi:hypothetical protein